MVCICISLIVQQFIICILLFNRIDYNKHNEKHIAFMMCVFPVFEIALLFIESAYGIALVSISLISIAWLTWSTFRRYSRASDELTNDYVYKIAKYPNSFITFLAAITGSPFGRYSYYFKGDVYYYHHDYFRKTKLDLFPLSNAVVIKTKIKASYAVGAKLEKMIGSKWSLFHNCMTVRLGNA